jgi:hypothetical protein
MAIIRGQRPTEKFYILRNDIADDSRLSLSAMGLLVYLLSRPSDWFVCESQLRKKWRVGRDKLRNLLTELVNAGYAQKQQARNLSTGKFDRNDWVISESPFTENPSTASPLTEKPLTDSPSTVNPTLTNNVDIPRTKNTKGNIIVPNPSGDKPKRRAKTDAWKQFFDDYPANKKGGTDTTAWKKAKSLDLSDNDFELMAADVRQRKRCCPAWYSRFALGICKYMQERFWLTPIEPENDHGNSQPLSPSAALASRVFGHVFEAEFRDISSSGGDDCIDSESALLEPIRESSTG